MQLWMSPIWHKKHMALFVCHSQLKTISLYLSPVCQGHFEGLAQKRWLQQDSWNSDQTSCLPPASDGKWGWPCCTPGPSAQRTPAQATEMRRGKKVTKLFLMEASGQARNLLQDTDTVTKGWVYLWWALRVFWKGTKKKTKQKARTGLNTHAHTHCSITQPLSVDDVLFPPPSIRTPPFTDDHMTKATTCKGHPPAARVISCHDHCANTHTVGEVRGVSAAAGLTLDISRGRI